MRGSWARSGRGEDGRRSRRLAAGLLRAPWVPGATASPRDRTPGAPGTPGGLGAEGHGTAATAPHRLDDVIGDCALYRDGCRVPGRLPLEHAVRAAEDGPGFVWLGLQQPDPAEVADVARRFRLPALAVEDAVKAHQRPKLEFYGEVLFLILKPVHYVDHDQVVEVGQLALFVGPGYVVTVRHGHSDVLGRVRAELDAPDAAAAGEPSGSVAPTCAPPPPQAPQDGGWHGPLWVLYRAADLVVDGYESALDAINEDIDEVETAVFTSAHGQDHSARIYNLKREIAEFRRAVLPLDGPLARLSSGEPAGTGGEVASHFRDVRDHLTRAAEAIEGHDRLLSDVLQANLARVATFQNQLALRQNEDMRRISAWAAIALVPTAVAGVYGMNFDNMPELRWRYGYYLVVGVIALACTALHRLFRRNGWL